MKIIYNAFFAFLITFLTMSLCREFATSPLAAKLTSWLFQVPMLWQTIFWWTILTFPHATIEVGSFLANGAYNVAAFVIKLLAEAIGQLAKYRAGQIALAALGLYLAYTLIF